MKPRLTLVAASLSAIFASQTFAQTAATLDPVVVTATRTAVSLTEVLADVSIVDHLQRKPEQSLSGLLNTFAQFRIAV